MGTLQGNLGREGTGMQAPVVKQSGGAIYVAFEEYKIGLSFDMFRDGREGLQAEVRVCSKIADDDVIGPMKIDLLSQRSLSETARTCLKHYGEVVPWDDLIPASCTASVKQYRAGSEPIALADYPDPGPPNYLIKDFLIENSNVFISAYGGSAKSVTAMDIGVCVATGEPFADMRPSQMGSVLYLDWEDEASTAISRMNAICRGRNIEPPHNLYYRSMDTSLKDSIRAIQRFVAANNVILVIIDSIGAAIGGELVKDEAALQGMAACKSLAPASRLIISHVSKADADKRAGERRAFGSAFFEFGARDVWQVGKTTAVAANTIGVTFANTKCNHVKKESFGLQISFNDDAISITRNQDFSSDVAAADGLSHTDLIFAILMRETDAKGLNVVTIADYSGLTRKQVEKAVYNLRTADRICRFEDGGRSGGETTYTVNELLRKEVERLGDSKLNL